MFNELTQKSGKDILQNMQNNITDDIEKTEGSFVYDALSPASKELESAYAANDEILRRTSPFTATGKDLENITKTVGITRKPGGKATTQLQIVTTIGTTIKANTLIQTPAGLIYKTIKDVITTSKTTLIDIIAFKIGSEYNVPANVINQMPIVIPGVISIINPKPVINGYDIEDDESLRKRYFERKQTPATSGNKAQYKSWAKEVLGVGDAKVFPLWNGNGTVKVVIINENKRAADPELVQNVKNYIDPTDGRGEGKAPIGAICTVISAIEKKINISVKITLVPNAILQNVQESLNSNIAKYLSNQTFNTTYISYAKLGAVILSTNGILDYNNLIINGGNSNIPIDEEEIPVPGAIELGV